MAATEQSLRVEAPELMQLIAGLPERVRLMIDVRGLIRMPFPDEYAGGGGCYDSRSKYVFVDENDSELDDTDVLHLVLYNYAEKISDRDLLKIFVRARYPPESAARFGKYIDSHPGCGFTFYYFGINDFTRALAGYFLNPATLSEELRMVFEREFFPELNLSGDTAAAAAAGAARE